MSGKSVVALIANESYDRTKTMKRRVPYLLQTIPGLITVIILLCTASPASAKGAFREELLSFAAGVTSTNASGRIRGYQFVDYQLPVKSGQSIEVTFKPGNRSAYFNVLPPGSDDEAIFIGSSSGNRFAGVLTSDGIYTLRVYLMRSAARRNETARYSLTVSLADSAPSAATESLPVNAAAFAQTLELQGIRFQITGTNNGSVNSVQITPSGLEIDNSPIVRAIDGTITGAEVADLNADGSPEIYVYVSSAGSGSYGSLVAYSANRRKSLSEIHLPSLTENGSAAQGYMGHDEFTVLEGVLGRRFPVYRAGDTNARPTGGMRQLQYRLVPGEAGWLLNVDRLVEY
jgi:hypothetical protein